MPTDVPLTRVPATRQAGVVLAGLVIAAIAPGDAFGASPILVARVLREIPRTEEELAEAHRNSRAASIQVPVGEPLEIDGFSGQTDYDVTVRENGVAVKRKLPFEFSRLGVITYGMEISKADEENLPLMSHNRILERVNGNYISIQLRVQRDAQSGQVYLHYKPFAAVGAYGMAGTQEFATLMEDSVRDLRGIGLYVKDGEKVTAERLRTFVAVNKNTMALPNERTGRIEIKPHYELMFVRARIDGEQVALHAFGTDAYRTKLHYFKPHETPSDVEQSTLKSTIFFTEYTAAKQSPTAKAARRVRFASQRVYEIEQLDRVAEARGLEGGALTNLTELLDAVIDGDIDQSTAQ